MKAKVLVCALLGTWLAMPADAQVNEKFADLNDEIELVRSLAQRDRQTIVKDAMVLTETEAQSFWPLYNEYRGAVREVQNQLVKVVTDYAAAYQTLTDEQAKSLVKASMNYQESLLDVRRKYLVKFEKVLPAVKVARFYQIENKLDAIVNLALAADIPLATSP
jgi:hypothetical protein